jgi:hemerythrin-like domain-containing protein
VKAIDTLVNEHRLIERVLDALDAAVDRLERGRPVRPGFFLDATTFLAGFADGCHHHKEEGVLFPAMIESGMPADGSPIAVMLQEHERGRVFTRAIRDAAHRLERGEPRAERALAANVRGYLALLRDHIVKEDAVLFPMAEAVLAAEDSRLVAAFDRVEEEETGAGAHERFHALADALIEEAGKPAASGSPRA